MTDFNLLPDDLGWLARRRYRKMQKRIHRSLLSMSAVSRGISRWCFTCRWFILRKEKPRNRMCRFPGKLGFHGNECLSWQLDPDFSTRRQSVTQ